MEACWKTLPRDLVERVLLYLDGATRRDVGMKPRRLGTLPQLELHRDKLVKTDYGVWLTLPKEEGTKVFQMTWSLGAFPGFFYQRTDRIKFMMFNGIEVWKDNGVHQDIFTGVPEVEAAEAAE